MRLTVLWKVAAGWAVGAVLASVSGCGRPDDGSRLGYVTWGLSSIKACTIDDLREPVVNICLEGTASEADLRRAKLWAARATLTWMRVLKMHDEEISDHVGFSCARRHLTIKMLPGSGRSFASASRTSIYMATPYGTWTHELGHALAALGDTYAGSTAGQCVSGQPASLMCWGAYGPRANPEQYSTLWPDDIAGIRENQKTLWGTNTVAPPWSATINPEAPLDLRRPWPTSPPVDIDGPFDHQVTILHGEGPTPIQVGDPEFMFD